MEIDTVTMNQIIDLLKNMYYMTHEEEEEWSVPDMRYIIYEGADLYADYFRNNN